VALWGRTKITNQPHPLQPWIESGRGSPRVRAWIDRSRRPVCAVWMRLCWLEGAVAAKLSLLSRSSRFGPPRVWKRFRTCRQAKNTASTSSAPEPPRRGLVQAATVHLLQGLGFSEPEGSETGSAWVLDSASPKAFFPAVSSKHAAAKHAQGVGSRRDGELRVLALLTARVHQRRRWSPSRANLTALIDTDYQIPSLRTSISISISWTI
jgi:hypothetical protein